LGAQAIGDVNAWGKNLIKSPKSREANLSDYETSEDIAALR
jgi:hypothetical protein